MKTKRLKLKRWASTVIYLSLITIVFVSMVFVSNMLDNRYGESLNLSYILNDIIDTIDVLIEKGLSDKLRDNNDDDPFDDSNFPKYQMVNNDELDL